VDVSHDVVDVLLLRPVLLGAHLAAARAPVGAAAGDPGGAYRSPSIT
jgi:hypothetical protein